MTDNHTLSILQYNVRKSKDTVMAPLLRDPAIQKFIILAIQEPWRNPFSNTTHHPISDTYHLIYPDFATTRTCFFISKQIGELQWTIELLLPDICAIRLKGTQHRQDTIIYNMYNEPGQKQNEGALPILRDLLSKNSGCSSIIVGDFNLKHALWGSENTVNQPTADELISIIEDYQLTILLPAGTITRSEKNSHSTIDLSIASLELEDQLLLCDVYKELDHDSDHLPIATILDINITPPPPLAPKPAWAGADPKALKEAFRQHLNRAKLPTETLHGTQVQPNAAEIDTQVETVISAITAAIAEAVPLSRPSTRSRAGFTTECKEAQMECRRLRRIYQGERTEGAWEAFRAARNYKTRLIKKALRDSFRTFVQDAGESPEKLWRLAKWARNRQLKPTTSIIPAIRTGDNELVTEPYQKAFLFQRAFFPDPEELDDSDIIGYNYPETTSLPEITYDEVLTALKKAPGKKAPGPDGIPNRILHALGDDLTRELHSIYNKCLQTGHYPIHFRQSQTVILRKPGKDDYQAVKSYRPIALLNTIGKILDSILTERIAYTVETKGLLPNTHFGGRKGRSTEHALHQLTERVFNAWNQPTPKVATLLLLDISGAFDTAHHTRLLHNLRKRGIDRSITNLIEGFLTNRITQIRVGNYLSNRYYTRTGIPQGSPLSPILYLFYNADLLEICTSPGGETTSSGYIDDTNILTYSDCTEENCRRLAEIHIGCEDWARKHASKFAPKKYELVHLTRYPRRFNIKQTLELPNITIHPSQSCKYLGIHLDQKLQWSRQADAAMTKAIKSITALNSLSGSTWGFSLGHLRQLYQAIVVPQLTYCASVWYSPQGTGGYKRCREKGLISVQYRALRAITGAFRATACAALEIESYIPPIRQRMSQIVAESTLRIRKSTIYHSLTQLHNNEISQRYPADWQHLSNRWSPLEQNIKWLRSKIPEISNLETVYPATVPPWWSRPEIIIHTHKDTAKTSHDRTLLEPDTLRIYTDGSGINGKIGAAAVAPQLNQTQRAFLGSTKEATVYLAEVCGINLALDIASQCLYTRAIIFIDNQAAIKSAHFPKNQSGQYLLLKTVQLINSLREKGIQIQLHWIPAHTGIPGNEAADQAAKEATGLIRRRVRNRVIEVDTNITAPRAPGFYLTASAKQHLNAVNKDSWIQDWNLEKHGRALHRIQPQPSPKTLLLYKTPRPLGTIIVQLRTGKIGLRQFLYQRKVPGIDSPECECNRGRQSVRHILFTCPLLKDQRREAGIRRPYLPGPEEQLGDILGSPVSALQAAKYMLKTHLQQQFRSVQLANS
jgi:ribonuclease HI